MSRVMNAVKELIKGAVRVMKGLVTKEVAVEEVQDVVVTEETIALVEALVSEKVDAMYDEIATEIASKYSTDTNEVEGNAVLSYNSEIEAIEKAIEDKRLEQEGIDKELMMSRIETHEYTFYASSNVEAIEMMYMKMDAELKANTMNCSTLMNVLNRAYNVDALDKMNERYIMNANVEDVVEAKGYYTVTVKVLMKEAGSVRVCKNASETDAIYAMRNKMARGRMVFGNNTYMAMSASTKLIVA